MFFLPIFERIKHPCMNKIKLLDKTFKPYISYQRISESIDKVAQRINDDYRGSKEIPVLLCVLNGSIMFTTELMKRLDFDCELMTLKLSSYVGTESCGAVKRTTGISGKIKGRKVIVIEDIVDTGNTLVELDRLMKEENVLDYKYCTLLLKPDMYNKDIPIDYVAMEIPNDFIVGFGLDYAEIGRNYKDIYIIDND